MTSAVCSLHIDLTQDASMYIYIQWNLRIADVLGTLMMSLIRRLTLNGGCTIRSMVVLSWLNQCVIWYANNY